MAEKREPFLVLGQTYFIMGQKDNWVGRLVEIGPFHVILEEASWVANCGRLHEFIAKGKTAEMEIEPVGTMSTPHHGATIIDWPHKLFTKAV